MIHDFTLAKYAQLCEAVLDTGYETATVVEYLTQPHGFARVVIWRHDVDRWPENAVRMGELEHSLGISSTYYFRATRQVFRSDLIRTLAAWGHEVGYHYETLATCNGNYNRAIQLFEQNLAAMRALYPVQTVAMHGSPLSRYDSRALWERFDYREYGLLGEVYLDIDYSRVGYVTDTGRSWGALRRNLRDRPLNDSIMKLPSLSRTDDLVALVRSQHCTHLLIQAHPERWAWSTRTFVRSYLADSVVNLAKLALSLARSEGR